MTSLFPEGKSPSVAPSRLSEQEVQELLSLRLIANLATFDRRGSIHIVPIWFKHEDDHIHMPTSHTTQKYRNLARNPRASVMIDISRSGLDLRGVLIQGTVQIVEGEEARGLNRAIHLRYVTAQGLRQPEVRTYLSDGDDVTLVLSMGKVVSWNNSASASGKALLGTGNHEPLDL